MNKLILLLITNILFTCPSIANPQMEKSLFEAKIKEFTNGKSKKWIIIDGVGIGLIINSSKNSESIIDQKLNEITHANGEIKLPNSKCKGNLNYFKGNILELLENEKYLCGEGRVIKYESASPLLQKLSNLLLLQEKIRSNVHNTKSDLSLTKKDIFKSVKELSSIVKKIKSGDYANGSKESVIQNLNDAIKLNLSAIQKIQSKEKTLAIFKDLSTSCDRQVTAIDKLLEVEKYD